MANGAVDQNVEPPDRIAVLSAIIRQPLPIPSPTVCGFTNRPKEEITFCHGLCVAVVNLELRRCWSEACSDAFSIKTKCKTEYCEGQPRSSGKQNHPYLAFTQTFHTVQTALYRQHLFGRRNRLTTDQAMFVFELLRNRRKNVTVRIIYFASTRQSNDSKRIRCN